MTRVIFIVWACLIITLVITVTCARAEPAASLPYKRQLIREVHYRWGLDGPVALMAAQIQQESGWRPGVCSPFACGLTQFTPATADWIKNLDPELSSGDRFNPAWAIRALVYYDWYLYNRVPAAESDCDRWAFVLSSYNGGLGWLRRDVEQCRRHPTCVSKRWWGNVENFSRRAGWAKKENRGYPHRILNNQSTYASWGKTVSCSVTVRPSVSLRSRGSRQLASGFSRS